MRRGICLGVCFGTAGLYLCGCRGGIPPAARPVINEVIDELQRELLGADETLPPSKAVQPPGDSNGSTVEIPLDE